MAVQQVLLAYAGTPPVVTVTLNPADKGADLTLSGGDLTVTRDATNDLNFRMVRATMSRNSGKYAFAFLNSVTTADGLLCGIVDGSATLSNHVGFTAGGFGIHHINGRCYSNNTQVGADFVPIVAGDYYTFAVDYDAGKIWVGRYSAGAQTWDGDPGAGTGNRFSFTPNTALFPAISLYRSTQVIVAKFNVGSLPFTLPSGFSAFES